MRPLQRVCGPYTNQGRSETWTHARGRLQAIMPTQGYLPVTCQKPGPRQAPRVLSRSLGPTELTEAPNPPSVTQGAWHTQSQPRLRAGRADSKTQAPNQQVCKQ